MKTIQDALLLRNWLIGLLERAEIEPDPIRPDVARVGVGLLVAVGP